MRHTVALLATLIALVSYTGQQARAGYVFDLNFANTAFPGAATNPYATLEIDFGTDNSSGKSTVTFTLTAVQANAGNPVNAVFDNFSFNTANLDGTFSLLPPTTPEGASLAAAKNNISIFGGFDWTVTAGNSANDTRGDPFVFTLLLDESSDADITKFAAPSDNGGYLFVAHMYTTGVTGYIAPISSKIPPPSNQVVVPAPPTAILALLGLPGFAAMVWARRRRVAVA